MEFEIWLAFLAATTLMSLFPGAGAVATLGNSLSHGARKSLAGIAGLQTGLLAHIILAGAGLGAVIASSATAFIPVYSAFRSLVRAMGWCPGI